jgi:hypothetical protein
MAEMFVACTERTVAKLDGAIQKVCTLDQHCGIMEASARSCVRLRSHHLLSLPPCAPACTPPFTCSCGLCGGRQ